MNKHVENLQRTYCKKMSL